MSEQMSGKEIQEWKDRIDGMRREEMCRLWRFAPSGHPCFDRSQQPICDYFRERFDALGDFSPEISKKIG